MKTYNFKFTIKINKLIASGIGNVDSINIESAAKEAKTLSASDFDCSESHIAITAVYEQNQK